MKFLDGAVYHAPRFYESNLIESHLIEELGGNQNIIERWGDLFYAKTAAPVFWQRNIWLKPFTAEFSSISQAAGILRSIQGGWAKSLFCCHRRGALIEEKLPRISTKPKTFPWSSAGRPPVGAWTLLNDNTLAASAECSSPFPAGCIEFVQNHDEAPSRAYLKLWEALARCDTWPAAGERCFDAGASPGGWTWALLKLGADVTACDRAPLAESVMRNPNVHFIKHDAFTLRPEEIGSIDWLLCDVISYPARLFEWVEKWLESGLCRRFICTIKMQGGCNFDAVRRFAAIPDSTVVHLWHNKHELTWIKA
ncbi:SAM-dependent methyltransferase [Spirochaetia bacterium]|nr:SAM-dependent methyltransferase [Spirochaetia bacterium]